MLAFEKRTCQKILKQGNITLNGYLVSLAELFSFSSRRWSNKSHDFTSTNHKTDFFRVAGKACRELPHPSKVSGKKGLKKKIGSNHAFFRDNKQQKFKKPVKYKAMYGVILHIEALISLKNTWLPPIIFSDTKSTS